MSAPKRLLSFLSWCGWSVATWLALAGAVCGLNYNPDRDPQIPMWHWLLAWTMPSIAVLCGWLAVRAGNGLWRIARVIFWMGSAAGVALAALLVQGRLEVSVDDRLLLLLAACLPALPLIFAFVQGLRSGGLRAAGFGWLIDIPAGVVCMLVVSAIACIVWVKTYVEPLRLKAGQRWIEIGHPMAEFEKSLQPVEENESLGDLLADLKPFGIVNFYKWPDTPKNTIETPPELMDLYVSTATLPGDMIRNVPKASAWLDARADDLNHLYQGVLQRDPPTWSLNPEAGILVRIPNFLAVRKLAEVICSDAYHRLQKNDAEGAANAVSAGLRIAQDLGDQPLMVSNMAFMNNEAMYAPVIARLPAQPGDMQQLAADTAASRRQFARTVQWEAWKIMHYLEAERPDIDDMRADPHRLLPIQPLPAALGRFCYPYYCKSFALFDCAKAWLYEADLVQISERAPELSATDLGEGEMDASIQAHLTQFAPDWSHAWLRINYTLLIREQALVIRHARALVKAGKTGSLGEVQSVVAPSSTWEITADKEKNTVSLQLTPVPDWATSTTENNSVMGAEFFMVPLDGRRPWQLLPVPPQAAK